MTENNTRNTFNDEEKKDAVDALKKIDGKITGKEFARVAKINNCSVISLKSWAKDAGVYTPATRKKATKKKVEVVEREPVVNTTTMTTAEFTKYSAALTAIHTLNDEKAELIDNLSKKETAIETALAKLLTDYSDHVV